LVRKRVKEFVYLGSLVTPNNDVSLEIQRRIQTANRCFFGLRERMVLCTISGPIVENGVYRRRYNFELDREFDNPSVINVVRYADHMIRRPEDLPQKVIFL
jgi:hypothetical protein